MIARAFARMARDGRAFAIGGMAMLIAAYVVVVVSLTIVESVSMPRMRARAEEDARAYGRISGLAHPTATCQSASSADGFVRCAVTDGARVVAVECRASLAMNYQRGCAPMRAVSP